MFKATEQPTNSEIQSVIRFLNARNVRPSDIHCQISEVYDNTAMSDDMVRKWILMFNEE
jgi:hypothetical protein